MILKYNNVPFVLIRNRVSYDDGETWQIKKQFAADKCLAGTLEWAVDMRLISSKESKEGL